MRVRNFRHAVTMGLAFVAASNGAIPQASAQSSSETYQYDALGQLVQVASSGGQNNGERQSFCYDRVGNRTDYKASADGTLVTCTGGVPPATGNLVVGNGSAGEGSPVVFSVTLNPAQLTTVNVNYSTAYGTAGASDFTAVSGTLTFDPGQTTKAVSVFTNTDTGSEPDETFVLNITSPVGPAIISDSQGVGTIYSEEATCGGQLC